MFYEGQEPLHNEHLSRQFTIPRYTSSIDEYLPFQHQDITDPRTSISTPGNVLSENNPPGLNLEEHRPESKYISANTNPITRLITIPLIADQRNFTIDTGTGEIDVFDIVCFIHDDIVKSDVCMDSTLTVDICETFGCILGPAEFGS